MDFESGTTKHIQKLKPADMAIAVEVELASGPHSQLLSKSLDGRLTVLRGN